ncbi:MAG: hypothetical protein IPF98_13405 [Gemmatimonadetes bacterium]|nr:hypothetical protein [Gemmatimonadota bacterium]
MLVTRHLSEHSLRGDRAQQLLRFLLEHGADEFSITVMSLLDTPAPFADAFEDELAPYERPVAARRVVTTVETVDVKRPVRLWTFSEASLARLLSFVDTGLLHWPAGPDGWLEDLAIYRHGDLVLGLLSHEREGVLRLTPQEHVDVAALDIPSEPTSTWLDD